MPKFVPVTVFLITKSMTIMKSKGDRMQPCLIPVTMSKSSVEPLSGFDSTSGVVV